MKKLSILSAILGLTFVGAASAADITIYHSPTCPHCHHARDFFKTSLIYEYPSLTITEVNVMDPENDEVWSNALKKCEYTSGGVPVIVVGEKCFQGYADFMQDELREAVEVDLSDADKATAKDNRTALSENGEEFRNSHADRLNSIKDFNSGSAEQKKNELGNDENADATDATSNKNVYLYLVLIALVAALGIVLVRRRGK